MRVLVVGAGGVGSSAALIAARRDFFESWLDRRLRPRPRRGPRRADRRPAVRRGPDRRRRRRTPWPRCAARTAITHVLNAVDPRYVLQHLRGRLPRRRALHGHGHEPVVPAPRAALRAPRRRCSATSSSPITTSGWPTASSRSSAWAWSRAWPTCSPATPPTSCSARSTSSACATRPTSSSHGYDFAPSFSIWTTIEECLNPPLIWEKERGFFTTEPFSEPEVFDFPEGIGPVECVNVEHEEVVLMPRVDRRQARDVQVRPRRRVHRGAADPEQAGPGPHRAGDRARAQGVARATSWPPACRTRSPSATR